MTGWEQTTLGEAVERGNGRVQTGPFGSQLHASDYVQAGVPVVMPVNIGENVINKSEIARVPEEDAVRLSRHRLHRGDIVFSRRGDVERRALVRSGNVGWLCGTGCLRVHIGDHKIVDPGFLSYQLGTPWIREWLINHAVGATMPNLNTRILSDVPIDLPPLREQRAIAEVLGALDDKIAANNALMRLIDEAALALVRSSLDSGEQIPLGAVSKVVMGSSPKGEDLNGIGQGTVFYQGIRDFGLRYPTRRVWTEDVTRLAEPQDTLFSVRAPVGSVNLAEEKSCVGRGIAAVRTTQATPYTLFHLLREDPGKWDSYNSSGTVYGSINRKQLQEVRIPAVIGERARTLEGELQALESSLAIMTDENRTLAETRDALLPQLMSGKLRVRDAEKVVSAAV